MANNEEKEIEVGMDGVEPPPPQASTTTTFSERRLRSEEELAELERQKERQIELERQKKRIEQQAELDRKRQAGRRRTIESDDEEDRDDPTEDSEKEKADANRGKEKGAKGTNASALKEMGRQMGKLKKKLKEELNKKGDKEVSQRKEQIAYIKERIPQVKANEATPGNPKVILLLSAVKDLKKGNMDGSLVVMQLMKKTEGGLGTLIADIAKETTDDKKGELLDTIIKNIEEGFLKDRDASAEIERRQQKEDEAIESFAARIQFATSTASQLEQINTFIAGLHRKYEAVRTVLNEHRNEYTLLADVVKKASKVYKRMERKETTTPTTSAGLSLMAPLSDRTNRNNFERNTKRKREDIKCYKCGKEGHIQNECPEAGDRKCLNCGKPNHEKKDCYLRGGGAWKGGNSRGRNNNFKRPRNYRDDDKSGGGKNKPQRDSSDGYGDTIITLLKKLEEKLDGTDGRRIRFDNSSKEKEKEKQEN